MSQSQISVDNSPQGSAAVQAEVIEDDEVIFLDVIDNLHYARIKFSERDALDELVH